jgi:hypothetical protein
VSYRLNIDHHRGQLELFLAQIFGNYREEFWFEHMIDRDAERYAGKRTGVAWITAHHGFRENLYSVSFTVAQNHRQVLRTILIRQALDDSLILKVHRACGGSNETLSGLKDNLKPGALQAVRDDGPGNAVPFTDSDHFFFFLHRWLHQSD